MSLRDYSRNFNRCDGLLAGTGNPESQSISPPETRRMENLEKVLGSIKRISADHDLDGGIAIRRRELVILHNEIHSLRELVILHNEIYSLRERLKTQKAGVREVIKAAVDLVCSPEWGLYSDEEEALEKALRKAGFVMPLETVLRKGDFVGPNEQN